MEVNVFFKQTSLLFWSTYRRFFNLDIYLNTSLAARHKVTSLTTWKRGLLAVDDLEAGLAWQGATVAAVLLIPLLLLLGVGRCCRR